MDSRSGISLRHGGHHVAQMFTSTTWPCKSFSAHALPCKSVSVKSACWWRRSSASTFDKAAAYCRSSRVTARRCLLVPAGNCRILSASCLVVLARFPSDRFRRSRISSRIDFSCLLQTICCPCATASAGKNKEMPAAHKARPPARTVLLKVLLLKLLILMAATYHNLKHQRQVLDRLRYVGSAGGEGKRRSAT